ncbi:MAG TPA: carbohydrate-binding protein [Vicinamibacterales bacterium]|nr:carbohydrate-binding protein [Vicinamibacterales bacterium]
MSGGASAATGDIVLYASDATNLHGNWARASDASAAAGQLLTSADNGWSNTDSALAAPSNYFDVTFSANAGTAYHVWLRLRASGNSKYNDSLFAQFSDAVDAHGAALFPIGTASGLTVNLATDATASSLGGWGWVDGAYWLTQASTMQFASSGTHTMRIQTREDGVQIDQVVLSPTTFLTQAPGPKTNDTTIVPKPVATTPFHTSAAAIPGTIQAEDFDNGGEGVAYHDLTTGNAGGAYRSTDVDIEPSTDGAYDIGWISAGEWLGYSVNVATAGTYLFEARVACAGTGGTFHLESGGVNLTGPLQIPATGGWQAWTTVSQMITLAAGAQQMKAVFDTASVSAVGNVTWFRFTSQNSTPYTGTAITLPGSFPAANFDNGGEGLAYHDTTSGNSGGVYRSTDVDIEASSLGGNDVGWIDSGEWLAYSVNVAAAGNYTLTIQTASPGSSGLLHARFGATDTPAVSVPNTGGWQNWTNVVINASLPAGPQTMKLLADAGGFNLGSVNVQAVVPVAPVVPPPSPGPIAVPVQLSATINIHAGDNLQAAIDNAHPGDTLLLDAGATFTGNFLLPAKSGSDFVTIRSAAPDASLPGATTRVDPSYASLLPKLVSPNTLPALATESGAHHYRLLALEFPANPLGYYDMLDLGDGSSLQNTLSSVPHDLVLDRLYMHGDVALGQKRAIGLNSASTTIENCYISDIKSVGQDAQAIAGWNGPGPYTIRNNYIEAAAENILFGGADPAIPNLVPSNITIVGNYITKQVAWRGQGWQVKNSLELKNAAHVTITGNTIENSWSDAQAGFIVVFTVRDQDGTAPWSTIADVTFSNNVVRHGGGLVNILGLDDNVTAHPSVRMLGLEISGNLVYDIDPRKWDNPMTGEWAVGRAVEILGGPQNVDISHNTILSSDPNTSPGLNSALTVGQIGDTYKTAGLTVNNNVMAEGDYGVIGDTVGAGVVALNTYAPGWLWNDNILIRGTSGMNYNYPATTTLNAAGVPVIDPATYGIVSGFSSTVTTDGHVIGADVSALRATIPGLDLTK